LHDGKEISEQDLWVVDIIFTAQHARGLTVSVNEPSKSIKATVASNSEPPEQPYSNSSMGKLRFVQFLM
jgi:hypothetical protein